MVNKQWTLFCELWLLWVVKIVKSLKFYYWFLLDLRLSWSITSYTELTDTQYSTEQPKLLHVFPPQQWSACSPTTGVTDVNINSKISEISFSICCLINYKCTYSIKEVWESLNHHDSKHQVMHCVNILPDQSTKQNFHYDTCTNVLYVGNGGGCWCNILRPQFTLS